MIRPVAETFITRSRSGVVTLSAYPVMDDPMYFCLFNCLNFSII